MQKACEQLNFEFRIKLQQEFSRRLRVNERYSIRAFALSLGIDSSTLSRILAGKKQVSEKKMSILAEKIGMKCPSETGQVNEYCTLDLDAFAVISDWYHYAILDLILLKSFKPNSLWIARKLNIKPHEAANAMERLKRLGMIKIENGKYVKGKSFYTNYHEGMTSAANKEYQRQVIKKALEAVDSCPQERKDITSITIAADSKKLEMAKEKIKQFRRQLCNFLEDGDRDAVYHFTLQLYPVTELEN